MYRWQNKPGWQSMAPQLPPPRHWPSICRAHPKLQITRPWWDHGGPGHLSPLSYGGMTTLLVVWSDTPGPENSRSQTSLFTQLRFSIKRGSKDCDIPPFCSISLRYIYFFSVSKSNNMKGNAAETFIKPTTHQKIECKSNCLLRKKRKSFLGKTVFYQYWLF